MRMPFWGKHDFLNFPSLDVFIRLSVSRKSANVGVFSYIFQSVFCLGVGGGRVQKKVEKEGGEKMLYSKK